MEYYKFTFLFFKKTTIAKTKTATAIAIAIAETTATTPPKTAAVFVSRENKLIQFGNV